MVHTVNVTTLDVIVTKEKSVEVSRRSSVTSDIILYYIMYVMISKKQSIIKIQIHLNQRDGSLKENADVIFRKADMNMNDKIM